jgi:trehalose 6-phosphate synthase
VADPRKTAAGGLAVALGEALRDHRRPVVRLERAPVVEGGTPGEGEMHSLQAGNVTLATVDLCKEDHDSFYLGYSQRRVVAGVPLPAGPGRFRRRLHRGYRRVNQMFARKLMPLLKPDDIIWVHDYHLIPLAAELRAMGCTNRIGFFLHIPLPPPLILAAIPQHEWLIRSLFAYDLVGFQAEADVQHFAGYVGAEAGAEALDPHHFRAFNRTVRAQAFPIGIDVNEFQALTHAKEARDMYETHEAREYVAAPPAAWASTGSTTPRAFRSACARFATCWRTTPRTAQRHADPDRLAVARDGRRLCRHPAASWKSLCGAINGDYGELDWMPVRYIHRMVARKRMPGLCRAARVGLVTPLRDGMNLVAKEYIVAQDPADPGVLVLSRFAGAAEQLKEALLVNPYDTHGTAET